MKRHLFIILNYGGIGDRLPNVRADKENYLHFFSSSEGGAWEEDEISVYENNFDFLTFEENVRFQQRIKDPYQYIVIVFCGHGFSEYGERYIEVRPEDTDDACVSLTQIKRVCHGTRTLFISDSCLVGVVRKLQEGGRISGLRYFTGDAYYRTRCKELYNSIVMATAEDIFTAGFAVSLGEAASDDERGGIYSQTLLDVAREIITYLKSDDNTHEYTYASFSTIHDEAAQKVIEKTEGEQHPSIEMFRSKYQLPFVVVPQ